MALLNVANKNSSTIARNQWLLDYPDRRVPSTSTISNQWYKFKKFDTVDDRVSIFYTHVFSNIISLFRFLNSTKKLISHGPSLLRRTRGAFMTTSCCKKRGDHLLGEMNLRTEDSKTSYNRITQELHMQVWCLVYISLQTQQIRPKSFCSSKAFVAHLQHFSKDNKWELQNYVQGGDKVPLRRCFHFCTKRCNETLSPPCTT